MPVNTPHPEYEKIVARWKRCRDAADGTDAIKAGAEEYLPPIDAATQDPATNEYKAYQERALFYGVTERTIAGLVGIILENDPVFEAPEKIETITKRASPSAEALATIVRNALRDQVAVGRFGLFVDAPPPEAGKNPTPWIATYRAEDILNWRRERIGDRLTTTMVVLKECRKVEDPKDPFVQKEIDRCRVLWLGTMAEATKPLGEEDSTAPVFADEGDLVYFQEVYERVSTSGKEDDWAVVERFLPRRQGGKAFNKIPFVFLNAFNLEPEPTKPPLSDLVDVNISHYQNSADREEGLHITALPTPYAIGCQIKGAMWLGPRKALVTENPEAKIGFLEFSGAGLDKIAEAMKEKEKMMAVLGARLLEEPKAGIESAEAMGTRMAGERSVLRTIAENASDAFTEILRFISDWYPGSENEREKISYRLTIDLQALKIDSAVLAALWSTYVQGGMSFSTFYYNIKRAGFIPKDRTEEEEKELIAMGGPGATGLESPDDEDEPPDPNPDEDEDDEAAKE